MKNSYAHYIPSLLMVALMTGCGPVEMDINTSANQPTSVRSVKTSFDDPCVLVLMPFAIHEASEASRIDKSIAGYQKSVTDSPHRLLHLERLGWAFVEKARASRDAGYYKLAEQAASCMESQVSDSAEALLLHGHVLHNLHQFKEAEVLARRVVEQRGLWFDFALLGDVLTERGALNEAIDAYQVVIDQRPGPHAYARIAHLRWLKGDLNGALEMMSQAVRSTSPRTPEAAAWAHVRLALLLMQANELPAADAVLTSALSLKPDYSPALHARGRLLLAQGWAEEALPLLQKAIQIDPLPEFRWTLFEALMAAGQHQAARMQKAALHKSGAIEDRRTFALFLATTGDKSETAVRLALAELEQREDVFTLDAIAWALSSAGLDVEALDYSQRALSEGTQDARLFLHAGLIAARAGDDNRSIEFLKKAKSIQHMLLPSERQQLANEFAELHPQIPTRVTGNPVYRTQYYF